MLDFLLAGIQSYPGLFAVCMIAGLLVPVPEDIVLLYVGMAVHDGDLLWTPTIFAVCAGVLVRDVLAYWVGRKFGDWLLQKPLAERVFGSERLMRARLMFERRGVWAVMIGRCMVGMRVPVFMVGGSMRTSFRTFLVWDTIGVLITVPAIVALGWMFGEPFTRTVTEVLAHTRITAGILAVIVVIVIVRYRTRPARTSEASVLHDAASDE